MECLSINFLWFLKNGFCTNLDALDSRMIRFSHSHQWDPLNDAQIYSWFFKMHGKVTIDTLLRKLNESQLT